MGALPSKGPSLLHTPLCYTGQPNCSIAAEEASVFVFTAIVNIYIVKREEQPQKVSHMCFFRELPLLLTVYNFLLKPGGAGRKGGIVVKKQSRLATCYFSSLNS